MNSDEELFKYIVGQMSPNQLQDTFDVNKIKLDGFRRNGKNTKAKILKMQITLKKRKDLESLLEKCTKYYIDNQKIDYMWAMPNQLNEDEINRKIKSTNKSNVIFELFAAKKIKELKKIMESEPTECNKKEEKNEQVYINNDSQNEESIEKIRNMLTKREKEYKILELKRNKELEELQKQKKLFLNLQKRYEKIKEELKSKNQVINNLEIEKDLFNKQIKKLKIEVNENASKVLTAQKYKIAIMGGETYEKYLMYILQPISSVSYKYLNENDFKYFESDIKFDALWVMEFSLSRKEISDFQNSELWEKYVNIDRCIVFKKAEKFYRIMDKVREFYE